MREARMQKESRSFSAERDFLCAADRAKSN